MKILFTLLLSDKCMPLGLSSSDSHAEFRLFALCSLRPTRLDRAFSLASHFLGQHCIMPSIAFQSRVRTMAETCTLTMIIEHRLILGQPSDVVHRLKPPPDGFTNILLGPQPIFTITGTVNNVRMSSTAIRDSHIVRHFVEYLRMVCSAELLSTHMPRPTSF